MKLLHCIWSSVILTIASVSSVRALPTGEAPGIAKGVTGGGDAEPVYPVSIEELVGYLGDSEPRVVILNQTFDFRGTEGTISEVGCRPKNNRECIAKSNGFLGQDVILQSGGFNNTGGCTEGTPVNITYDVAAAKTKLQIRDNKTLRGVAKNGVIVGKGLAIAGDNVIVQNIHITNLNPHVIWGGDALFIQGKKDAETGQLVAVDKVWIDHVKVSEVGRQMIAVNKGSAKSLTISNCDFDGRTTYSSTCDGRHYWTMLFLGFETRINFINNYIHDTSGRSPKIGGDTNPETDVVVHVVNNHWFNNTALSFDVQDPAFALIEGNVFEATSGGKPNLSEAKTRGAFLVPSASNQELCVQHLGRKCVENAFTEQDTFAGRNESAAAARVKEVAVYEAQPPQKLALAEGNFGVADLQ